MQTRHGGGGWANDRQKKAPIEGAIGGSGGLGYLREQENKRNKNAAISYRMGHGPIIGTLNPEALVIVFHSMPPHCSAIA